MYVKPSFDIGEGINVLTLQEIKLLCEKRIGKAVEPFLPDNGVCISHAVGIFGGRLLLLKTVLLFTNISIVTDEKARFIFSDFVVY